MLQVPEIRAPDEEADEDDKSSSSGPPSLSSPAISVPALSLHVPSDDSSPAGESCVTLQVPCMGDMPPGRLEPPRSLHLSLPPFPQSNIPSLLQVPGFHGPRRRHSWICGYVARRAAHP
ncbi:uncharacterized protein LOC122246630 [Penaeus japonicus]|uniref:uncharacterized protein LOC122246630 n=1 Tax=Penaeus japonicus TaxID=27405 RepID=UPI001C70FAE1|nr:uncharacterized protein LOC122246630 [Penaeus japonicus]